MPAILFLAILCLASSQWIEFLPSFGGHMGPKPQLLSLFVMLSLGKSLLELFLQFLNRRHWENTSNQEEARKVLGISEADFQKTLLYSRDKYNYSVVSGLINLLCTLAFIICGGFGVLEGNAIYWNMNYFHQGEIVTGLLFFAQSGVLSYLLSLPFSYYMTFHLEEKHGFNRQTKKVFWSDQVKAILLGVVLGGLLLSGLLAVMSWKENWWFWAWAFMSTFSLLMVWVYPNFFAPLFNKFSPLEEGELQKEVYDLAQKVDFQTSGIFIMDASTRSSHGNAYFTGLFREKRIVLFDTLLKTLSPKEIVAVLAHELGHFKLNHVRFGLFRSILFSGLMFYALSLCLPLEQFYKSLFLTGVTNYGALLVFSLWFSLIDFFFTPLNSWISRRHEFQADAFAKKHLGGEFDHLPKALLKLSESNHSMPISHPVFSFIYYSHPPLLERIKALR